MSTETNPVVGFGRLTDLVTFTAQTAATDYPATNLKELPLAQIWESSAAGTQWIKGEFDQKRAARLFMICRHNFSTSATFRLRLYEDAAATQATEIYDSDADTDLVGGNEFWPVVYGDELEWESDEFLTGKYSDRERSDTVWYRPIWLDRLYDFLSFRIDFTDDAPVGGVMRVGLIEVAEGVQFSRGFAFGGETGFEPRTTTVTAFGGVSYHGRRNKKRIFNGQLPFVPRDEAQGRAYELLRQHDEDIPFAWIPDPTDTKNWLRDAFLAKNARLTALQRAQHNYQNVALNLKEAF